MTHGTARQIHCIGCNARVPDIDGPTHAYIGASPGCWKIFGDVLSREYGEFRNPDYHRLTVDAYAVQHPGIESRRSTQSVGVHLIALHLVFEHNLQPLNVTKRMSVLVDQAPSLHWLTPPRFSDTASVLLVADARSPEDHKQAVWDWARSVWGAWSSHHETVREWACCYNI